jgi:Icc-related predicted phosphoesterase
LGYQGFYSEWLGMKILCVSDQIDPLVYSDSIKTRFADVDMILGAGDLHVEYLDFIVSNLNKPLFFVLGNHHTQNMIGDWSCCPDTMNIGSKVRQEGGIIVAGLGGSMRYNLGPNQFTDFQMFLEIAKLVPALLYNRLFRKRYLDILLTHAPPKGIHDKPDICHSGFKAFLWFIKIFKPKYLVHGHIHLYDLKDIRCTRCMQTEVVNAYGHYVIDTKNIEGRS